MIKFSQFLSEEDLIVEAGKASGYSDEHAFVHTWNHMVKKGIAHDKEAMHKEIDDAQKDENHPLNHQNISSEGFKGGDKKNSSKESYTKEMHHAADTIHTVATHPDFKGAVENKHEATVAGASHGKVSDSWGSHGAKNATSKADIKIGTEHKLSYKKSGGSQLMSAEPAETKATYHHVASEMKKEGKITNEQESSMKEHANKVSEHLAAMKTAKTTAEKVSHKEAAQKHIDAIHSEHPEVNNYAHHEAASGNHKFGKGGEGAATHILSSYNHKTGSAGLHHVNEYKHGTMKTSHPRVALPKGDGRPGNVKIDIKD